MTATKNRHSTLAILALAALLTLGITYVLSGLLHKDEVDPAMQEQYVAAVRDAYEGQPFPFAPASYTKTDEELVTYGKTLCDRSVVLPQLQPMVAAAQMYLCP